MRITTCSSENGSPLKSAEPQLDLEEETRQDLEPETDTAEQVRGGTACDRTAHPPTILQLS